MFRTHLMLLLLIGMSCLAHCEQGKSQNKKVNQIFLLFPQINKENQRNITTKLQAINGCYKWSSSKLDLIKIEERPDPDNPTCNSECQIIYQGGSNNQNIFWITANDYQSDTQLKIETRINPIKRIEIFTTFRTLEVDMEQQLQVVGYDEEGNTFSSLEGIKFQWTIEQDSLQQILGNTPLMNSKLKTTDYRKNLENNDFQTDIFIVKGMRTGRVKVRAKIIEKGIQVQPAEVYVQVIEYFRVVPEPEVYLLQDSLLQTQLFIMKYEQKEQQIKLPTTRYSFQVRNLSLASAGNDGLLRSFQQLGSTLLVVNDTLTSNNSVSTVVHVVVPSRIDLKITEFAADSWDYLGKQERHAFNNNWNLVKNEKYYLRVFAYDSDDKGILITQNQNIEYQIPAECFRVEEKRLYEIVLTPTKLCSTKQQLKISATLKSSNKTLNSEYQVYIFSKVKILSPFKAKQIVLPYIHVLTPQGQPSYLIQKQQTYKVPVIGGSSKYSWYPENPNIIQISKEGVVSVINQGETFIVVKDEKNLLNQDVISVTVSPVHTIEPLEQMKEFIVGQQSTLYAIARSTNNQIFSNCSYLKFKLHHDDLKDVEYLVTEPNLTLSYEEMIEDILKRRYENQFVRQLLDEEIYSHLDDLQAYIADNEITTDFIAAYKRVHQNYGICAMIQINPVKPGKSRAMIEIANNAIAENQANLLVDSPLQYLKFIVYDHFQQIQPSGQVYSQLANNEVVLSYFSGFVWEIRNGPFRWDQDRKISQALKLVDQETKRDVSAMITYRQLEVQQYNGSISFFVECTQQTQQVTMEQHQVLKYIAQNLADKQLPYPQKMEYYIKMQCTYPSRIEIHHQKLRIDMDQNKITSELRQDVHLKNQHHHWFKLIAYNNQNQPFLNHSSMQYDWSLTESRYAKLTSISSKSTFVYNLDVARKILQYCELCTDLFQVMDIANITGSTKLRAASQQLKVGDRSQRFQLVQHEINLFINPNLRIIPDRLLLYYNQSNTYSAKIVDGSGNFELRVNNSKIVDAQLAGSSIEIRANQIGQTQLTVVDKLQNRAEPATCVVEVQEPYYHKIVLQKEIIQANTATILEVHVMDQQNRTFGLDQYKYISLSINQKSLDEGSYSRQLDIYQLAKQPRHFQIVGLSAGTYQIGTTIRLYGDRLQYSINQVTLQVFDNFKSYPSEILLSVGCKTILKLVGGLPMNTKILFKHAEHPARAVSIQKFKNNEFFIEALENTPDTKGHINFQYVYTGNQQDEVLTEINIPLTVNAYNGIQIRGQLNRAVYKGATIRLTAQPTFDNKPLTFSFCPFYLRWKSLFDNSLVIQPGALGSGLDRKDEQKILYQLGVNAFASDVGYAAVQVAMSMNEKFTENVHQTEIQLQVIEEINVTVPHFIQSPYNQLMELMLPPRAEFVLKPNSKQQNLLVQLNGCKSAKPEGSADYGAESAFRVTSFGVIQTSGQVGETALLVLRNREQMQSELRMAVKIQEIHSMMVANSEKLINLQIDSDSTQQIYFLDSFGRQFATFSNYEMGVFISNPSIVDIHVDQREQFLVLKPLMVGQSICYVYLKSNQSIYDVFQIVVKSIITPRSPVYVHVGGVAKFKNNGAQEGNSDYWFVEERYQNIMEVDRQTGVLRALGVGQGILIYQNSVRYRTAVNVLQASGIEDMPQNRQVRLTNANHLRDLSRSNNRDSYRFNLTYNVTAQMPDKKIVQIKQLNDPESEINNNLNFTCRAMQNPEWFVINSFVDIVQLDTNQIEQYPVCMVQMMIPENYPEQYTYMPSHLELQVQIKSASQTLPKQFILTREFSYLLEWQFKQMQIVQEDRVEKQKNNEIAIKFNPQNRFFQLRFFTLEKLYLDFSFESKIQQFVQGSELYANKTWIVNINIPESQVSAIEESFIVKNRNINQKSTYKVIYDPSDSKDYSQSSFNNYELNQSSSKGFTKYDLLILLVFIYIIYKLGQKLLSTINNPENQIYNNNNYDQYQNQNNRNFGGRNQPQPQPYQYRPKFVNY